MRRGVPQGSPVCDHGYSLSGRGMHPDGVACLPAGITEGIDATRLVGEILGAPSMVLASAAGLDAHGLAAHLLRAGYRFVDPDEKHVIDLRDEGWTIRHTLSCRALSLFSCPVTEAAARRDWRAAPAEPGRYECEEYGGNLVILDRVP